MKTIKQEIARFFRSAAGTSHLNPWVDLATSALAGFAVGWLIVVLRDVPAMPVILLCTVAPTVPACRRLWIAARERKKSLRR
jgi:hypothetical protein